MNILKAIWWPIQITTHRSEAKLAHKRIVLSFFTALICLFIMQSVELVSAASSKANSDLSKWLGHARVAGAEVYVEMEPNEIEQILNRLVKQKVNVVEADSNLTDYLTDAEFERELKFIKRFTQFAHQKGLRVVWYYPVLEVLSPRAEKKGARSMFKDHPDWVQLGLNRKPNVFYGGKGRIHWVEKGTESAWMTLQSPYAKYYLERIKKLAATGVDGLWVDVPLLNDIAAEWSDHNPYARAKFKSDTGLTAPSSVNWSNKTWRRWVAWRHKEIAGFIERIAATARSVSSNFSIIVENVTLDNGSATQLGLDGTRMKSSPGIIQAWEVDALSDTTAMRHARPDDWISLIAMNKFAKAASGDKPSWVFNYGLKPDDAGLVMAETLATGNHPYETRIPQMNASVGPKYRLRMYSWIKRHEQRLFKSTSASKVAVYFSPESRDYLDKGIASGLYASMKKDDPLWWSGVKAESVYNRTYLAEYRGMVKWLVHQHIPFDVLVKPSKKELEKYDVVLAPALSAISNQAVSRLRQYVLKGGNLILTGPAPLGQNEFGTRRRTRNALKLRGKNGKGHVRHLAGLIGKKYLTTNDAKSSATLSLALKATTRTVLTTNADKAVHIEMRERPGEMLLHFVNATGVKGNFSIPPINFNVGLTIPEGLRIKQITLTSPDLPEGKSKVLNWTHKNDIARFDVSMLSYAVVIVSYDNSVQAVENDLPVAANDNLSTPANTQLMLGADKLLGNDGDLDGDKLELLNITALGKIRGHLKKVSSGDYLYTPPPGFIGRDIFQYSVKDAKGAVTSARIHINVHRKISKYSPKAVKIETGEHRYGTTDNLARQDTETYDINAAHLSSNGRVVDWTTTIKFQESLAQIESVRFVYTGQYSLNGIDQTISFYNYKLKKWEVFDSRKIDTGDDVTFSVSFSKSMEHYVSENSEMRLKLRGYHRRKDFASWANAAVWEVKQRP